MTDFREPTTGDTSSSDQQSAHRPLRVIIGADTFTPDVNGSAKFAEHLASGLASRGHDVHVVVPAASRAHGTWIEEFDGQKVTAHRLFSLRWPFHDWLRFVMPWTIRRNSARIIDEVQPDVVHFQSHIVVGRGLAAEAQKRGIRLIGTNHVMPENLTAFMPIPQFAKDIVIKLAWKAAWRSFSKAEAVTAPTRRAADFFERGTGMTGTYAISCGIKASDYTADFTPRTGNRILFVGRVAAEKQIDVLLKALQQLPADLDATLEVVGGGDQLKNLQNMAVSLGLGDRVTFTGRVSDAELRAAYTRATVFAMPSIAELQSIATMEALASGLPVVAADAMALPHLVHDGENGYLFTPSDPRDLAEKLERVLRLPEDELQAMKRESLDIVAAHDIDRTLATFEHLYRGEPVTDPLAARRSDATPSTPAAPSASSTPSAPRAE